VHAYTWVLILQSGACCPNIDLSSCWSLITAAVRLRIATGPNSSRYCNSRLNSKVPIADFVKPAVARFSTWVQYPRTAQLASRLTCQPISKAKLPSLRAQSRRHPRQGIFPSRVRGKPINIDLSSCCWSLITAAVAALSASLILVPIHPVRVRSQSIQFAAGPR
jgi:hypothetical protein